MSDQLELALPDPGPFPGEDDPRTLRHWLFAGFVAALNDAADRAEPATKPADLGIPPDAGPIVDYYEARSRALALRHAAWIAERAMRTREEHAVWDRANSRLSPPGEAELECLRHHDRCTICLTHEAVAERMQEEIDRLEQVRVIFLSGIGDVFGAFEETRRAVLSGDDPTLTLAKVEKALKRTDAAAYKRWQKRAVR